MCTEITSSILIVRELSGYRLWHFFQWPTTHSLDVLLVIWWRRTLKSSEMFLKGPQRPDGPVNEWLGITSADMCAWTRKSIELFVGWVEIWVAGSHWASSCSVLYCHVYSSGQCKVSSGNMRCRHWNIGITTKGNILHKIRIVGKKKAHSSLNR